MELGWKTLLRIADFGFRISDAGIPERPRLSIVVQCCITPSPTHSLTATVARRRNLCKNPRKQSVSFDSPGYAIMDNKTSIIVPILMITVGIGWILTVQGVIPEINWVWSLALAVVGFLIFVLAGFNKFSLVAGGFFILASGLSLLRQTGRLTIEMEVPIIVIAIGVLLLIARSPAIPVPEWFETSGEKEPSPPKAE